MKLSDPMENNKSLITNPFMLGGVIPLVAKGYGTLGYVSIFVIIIPILVKGIIGWDKKGSKAAE